MYELALDQVSIISGGDAGLNAAAASAGAAHGKAAAQFTNAVLTGCGAVTLEFTAIVGITFLMS